MLGTTLCRRSAKQENPTHGDGSGERSVGDQNASKCRVLVRKPILLMILW